jgi:hypothetical protein
MGVLAPNRMAEPIANNMPGEFSKNRLRAIGAQYGSRKRGQAVMAVAVAIQPPRLDA